MRTLSDFDFKGKKVIVRVDFNVPIQNGKIDDDNRIKESLTTIKYLIKEEAKIILLSHLGKIKNEEDKAKNTLKPVSIRLSELLNKDVKFIDKTRGKEVEEVIKNLTDSDLVLLENTRHEDVPNNLESGCDEELSKYWASLGDLFVLDAFGSAHRNHASTYGIPKYIPGCAGFLIEKELKILDEIMLSEKDVIMGGAKVKDKLGVIENLIESTNSLLIGGAMSYTFLKAKGFNVGKSLIDNEKIDYVKTLLNKYSNKIILPVDVVTQNGIKKVSEMSDEDEGFDVGPETVKLFKSIIKKSPLVIWNGPLGMFENEKYAVGTKEILKYLNKNNIKTVIGGGDTGSAANKYGYKFYHVSTGGGATLEYLEGKKFKTLEVLENKKKKIILNHKSYLNYDEINKYKKEIEKIDKKKFDLILFPSIIYLSLFKNSKLNIGTQNFYTSNYGSYTGEANLESLKYIGVNYTLVGHSERKKLRLERIELTKEKLIESLNSDFKTILLVGELYKKANPFNIIKAQLKYYLKEIKLDKLKNLSIAYEPAWAVGGSQTLSINKISKIVSKIKQYIFKKYKFDIEVYYGGSVTENSIKEILEVTDGVLIGKISSDIDSIKNVIKTVS